MTKIYLIRHAEAEGNLYRIAQGQYNSILTDRGWRQVDALSRRFADVHIDAVYASDLYRTCATASSICKPKGLPCIRHKGLREICVGVWEEKTWGQIAKDDPEQLYNFNHHLSAWHADGAETPDEVRTRVLAAIRQIAAENDGKTVAVFSHGCCIRILLSALHGLTIADMTETSVGDNTSVALLEGDADHLDVVFENDSSHLSDPLYLAGERAVKRSTGMEPGLYFAPLQLPRQIVFFTECSHSAVEEGGPCEQAAMAGAKPEDILVGYLKGEPVGLLQFNDSRDAEDGCGWISLFYMREEYRCRGYGTQLLGQAVNHFRPLGRKTLRIATPENRAAQDFFADLGFRSLDLSPAQRDTLEKDISFREEFLSAE